MENKMSLLGFIVNFSLFIVILQKRLWPWLYFPWTDLFHSYFNAVYKSI